MNVMLHSYTGAWEKSSSSQATFYDNGDGSGRLRAYDGSVKDPLLWDTTKTSMVPFTCSIQSSIVIKVWVTMEESPTSDFGIICAISDGSIASGTGGLPEIKSVDGKFLVGFRVTVQLEVANGQTPWCFNQPIPWNMTNDNGLTWTRIPGPAPLFEVYGICQPQPQFFLDDGIPIDLLRLFVPTSLTSLTTEQEWINWVTNVCHGKQDPKGTPGLLRPDSTQHWLRYNVWDGAFSFVGENGGKFSLMGWLNTYTEHQRDPTQTLKLVNCFDQAAIVETALGLGVAYNRLHWEIVAPFGYIDEDLVGWGSTNSPFFEGDTQNKRFTDAADPMRTPFRSHVFLTIAPPSAVYVKSDSMVVDACAGPVAGDLTYTQYLTQKALQDGIRLLEEGHILPEEPWNGVQTTTGSLAGWTLNNKLETLHPGKTVDVPTVLTNLNAAFSDTPTVSADFDAEAVIKTILDPILTNTGSGMVLSPQSGIFSILNDSTVVPGAVTTRLSTAGKVVNAGPTFISFQISQFTGGLSSATDGLQQRFNAFTLPATWVKEHKINVKNLTLQGSDGTSDSRATVFGTYHLNLFLYKNLVVQIAGNSNSTSDAMPGWTQALWTELEKY